MQFNGNLINKVWQSLRVCDLTLFRLLEVASNEENLLCRTNFDYNVIWLGKYTI